MTERIEAALRPDEHRVGRPCSTCGGFDDHPRHVHVDANGVDHVKHLDCCAADGCPTGTCAPQLEGAKGATGAKLLAHIRKIHGTEPGAQPFATELAPNEPSPSLALLEGEVG